MEVMTIAGAWQPSGAHMKRIALTLVSLLLLANSAWSSSVASRALPGSRVGNVSESPFLMNSVREKVSSAVALVDLPAPQLSADALAKLDGTRPAQIGIARRNDLLSKVGTSTQLSWTRIGSSRVAQIEIRSRGARGLRVAVEISPDVHLRALRVAGQDAQQQGADALLVGGELARTLMAAADGVLWTPATDGETQTIEIEVEDTSPSSSAVRVVDVSHLFRPVEFERFTNQKLLSCEVNYSCYTDTTISAVGKAVAGLVITTAEGSFVCSGALLNDRSSSGTPWFTTAYHCGIRSDAVAASLEFRWYYERACGSASISPQFTRTIGAQHIASFSSVDFTLLKAMGPFPAGLRLLGWNSNDLSIGQAVFGIHHPGGNPKAISLGGFAEVAPVSFRVESLPLTISGNHVRWQTGVTEGGSSGSPLMSTDGAFRGSLSAGPINSTCSTAVDTYYSRFSLIYPLIRAWIDPVISSADDWPDSPTQTFSAQQYAFDTTVQNGFVNSSGDQDWFRFNFAQPGVWLVYTSAYQGSSTNTYGRIFGSSGTDVLVSNDDDPSATFGQNFLFFNHAAAGQYFVQVTGSSGATGPYILNSLFIPDDDHSDIPFLGSPLQSGSSLAGSLSRDGDIDYFIVDVAIPGQIYLSSSGGLDTVGFLLNSRLDVIATNDDVAYPNNLNFSIQSSLSPGRYYLGVVGYDYTARGSYQVTSTFTPTSGTGNYTALWWNRAESGWGINLNHQGNTLFGTLFTYDSSGAPMWLVMSGGLLQSGSTYVGDLYRTTGPPFNAVPFTPITSANVTRVGSMSVTFSGSNTASLNYSVDGIAVSKLIEKQVYGSRAANCSGTSGSRAGLTNYQDLWWNPAESGWGLNITHQDNTLFATLFTYDVTGKGVWLVMSAGLRQPDGSYSGDLYVTSGPPFNAMPFSPIGPANVNKVGTMQVRFSDGNNGTLIYSINGTSVTKQITRQVFSSPVPACN